MANFWNLYIILLVAITVIGSALLLQWTRYYRPKNTKDGEKLDHSFDGIEELNTPLPKWWLYLFWLTIIFSIGYLALYPGFGYFKGTQNWSAQNQWAAEKKAYDDKYGPIFAKYAKEPIESLIHDENAMTIGKRLFTNNCATCHGADAKGMIGFPNLTDNDWIYGGLPEEIETSILDGRNGYMPPQQPILRDEETIKQVVEYVLYLNNRHKDEAKALKGEKTFKAVCATCHGEDGKGNKLVGAPNLTNNKWTHGGSPLRIELSIRNGRQGMMPAHRHILGEERVHLLAAYIYSLSHEDTPS